jgi:DNA-binding NtrC family response regulator
MARSQKSTRALLRLLDGSATPVYVLDARRTLVFCNAALGDWLGVDDQELLGVRADYHEGGEAAPNMRLAARLCPPPDAFHGAACSTVVVCETPRGVSRRLVYFTPLREEPGESTAVLAVVGAEEIDERDVDRHDADVDESARMHRRLAELRHEFGIDRRLERLVGESDAIRRVRDQVQLAASSHGRVLLVGPRGSGAEGIARAIHAAHPEPRGRLVPLACPLLDAELLQAGITDLKRPSRHRPVDPGGTLLLLEVDQLAPDAQDELAGFLTLPGFELATIATAEAPLLARCEAGAFRRDLAHLLSTLVIELPLLARRAEDIPLLAQQLLEEANAAGGKQFSGFTPEALDALAAYHWPGDVDELAEVVRNAHQQATTSLITAADLSPRLRSAAHAAAYPLEEEDTVQLDQLLADIEVELIRRALERAKGNKSRAAELLGVTRARLHRRLSGDNGEAKTKPEQEVVEGPIFTELEDDAEVDADVDAS